MQMVDRPLTSEERVSITSFIQKALKRIGADRASAPDPDKLQQLVSQAIDMYRNQDDAHRDASLLDATVSLGSLWGQVICDQMGWTWVSVRTDTLTENYGIVSPNRSHLIFPLHCVKDLLIDSTREQNSLALYNQVRFGILPPANEREYRLLGSNV